MKHHQYIITLTNGKTEQTYQISAFGERSAIILAQAEAINLARGFDLVSAVCLD